MSEPSFPIRDYLMVLRRRKWWLLLPAALIIAVATTVAAVWPATYRSEATILIEDAEIPEDVIGSLVTDYIEKRLEAIDRRVMTSDSLRGMLERYDLYPEERKVRPMAVLIEQLREDISREMIRANVVDPRSGQRRSVSVAFTLAFDYGTPETAQRITNELVTLYLNENLRQRRELASETTGFLRGERERVEQQIAELERRLAEFKRQHNEVLPERLTYNQQMVARAEEERRDLDRQIQSLRERDSFIAAQLTSLDPYLPETVAAGPLSSPAARLDALRGELASLTARYGGTHPDVVRTRREVELLERSVGGSGGGRASLQAERSRLVTDLAGLRQRYTADHPDVRRAERELQGIEDALRVAGSGAGPAAAARVSNPAFVTLQAQLAGIRSDLEASLAQRQKVEEVIAAFQELVLRTPSVEGEYAGLQRQIADLAALRDDVAQKETSARLSEAVESGLKAERLSLIEPPSLPGAPESPNRKLILLLGLVLGLGAGGGMVVVRQLFDEAMWSPRDIASVLGAAPLAVVPRITTPGDRARHWAAAATTVLLVIAVGGAGVWLADRRYGPLDIYAYEVQRRASDALRPYLPDRLRELLPRSAGA